MKNILLSVVVVAVLVAGGIGGTLAHFSDTEESFNNYIQTDEMDLKVSTVMLTDTGWVSLEEYDDKPYGKGVPALIHQDDFMVPCRDYSFHFDLHNVSEATRGLAYLHLKNPRCVDIPTKNGSAKSEPELVAELGGQLGQVQVPGIGDIPCFLSRAIEVVSIEIESMNGTQLKVVDLSPYNTDNASPNMVMINELICHNIPLIEIPPCNSVVVLVRFHLIDLDEDPLIASGLIPAPANPAPGDGGYFDGTDPDIKLKCWDHWPSNAFQKDRLLFDILFSLAQVP
jgi:predicted ribosomally synthesized peptide with SipW-like signal peptide